MTTWNRHHKEIVHLARGAVANIAPDGARLLFACESGSRAWGFASPDSDFDIRGVYVNPLEWYVRIGKKGSDTITSGGIIEGADVDIHLWELSKFLFLMRKGNASPYEWLKSEDIYYRDERFFRAASSLALDALDCGRLAYHYKGLAKEQYYRYIDVPEPSPTVKNYLYTLRGIMAVDHINKYHDRVPPIRFDKLLERVPMAANVRDAIRTLAASKAGQGELSPAKASGALALVDKHVKRKMDLLDDMSFYTRSPHDMGIFNSVLRDFVLGKDDASQQQLRILKSKWEYI